MHHLFALQEMYTCAHPFEPRDAKPDALLACRFGRNDIAQVSLGSVDAIIGHSLLSEDVIGRSVMHLSGLRACMEPS